MRMMEISAKLSEPIRVQRDELIGVEQLAQDIKSNPKDANRDIDEIRAKVEQGYIIEAAVAKALDATKAEERLIYDLLYNREYRIEVKDIGKKRAGKDKGKPKNWLENTRDRLCTLNKYYMAVDYLVVGTSEVVDDGLWDVEILYVAKCYRFKDYYKDSKFEGPRYFDHKEAAKDGHAIIIK